MVTVSLIGCSKVPAVFGDPTSADFADIHIAAIKNQTLEMIDQPVRVTGPFMKVHPEGFIAGKEVFEIGSDFGNVLIVVPPGKYTAQIDRLERKDPVVINGFVTMVIPPGLKKSILAIEVKS
jgi:hypothetical protein